MIIFPAIDIKDSKCVRLVKGDFDKIISYDNSPFDQAKLYFKNGFKTKKELIKVKVLQKDEFIGNIYTQHGLIFEEVANLLYQKRNNTNVIDFGLVRHPKIKILGASPDGITKEGIMLNCL